MPRVLNRRQFGIPAGAVYVGRPTIWGNPFVLGRDGDRKEVLEKYRAWLYHNDQRALRLRALRELRGKDLVCWCAPDACHADVLMELINV